MPEPRGCDIPDESECASVEDNHASRQSKHEEEASDDRFREDPPAEEDRGVEA